MDESLALIVLADDPLARAGLAAMLASLPGITLVGQYGSNFLDEGDPSLFEVPSDLLVWDTGWDSFTNLREDNLEAGLPVLALVADADTAKNVWRLGCRAILPRQIDELTLSTAMRAAAAGLVVVHPAFASLLVQENSSSEAPSAELTPRETAVLLLLAEGLTNKAIAHQLSISDHTVKFHVNAIMSKLDAQSRTDAVVRATRLGLIAL